MLLPNSSLQVFNLNDFQVLAKQRLSRGLYEYLSSGSDDEQTLTENRIAYRNWYLRPRVMRPLNLIHRNSNSNNIVCTRWNIWGHSFSIPVFVTPAGVHGLCDPRGECATATVCCKENLVFALSQHSTRSIEDISQEVPDCHRWYQVYILRDRALTIRLVQRAVHAGYKAIILTVDSVVFGYREADARNEWNSLPPPHRLVNYDEDSNSNYDQTYNAKAPNKAWDQNIETLFDTQISWDDVRWLKQNACAGLPLIIKGIMTGEDANLAIKAGADCIMVSNHGGRQLDGILASIDALPEVVHAVRGRVPIFLDGGIRRGTDILKALALGATAVGIGRPVFYALAVGGEPALATLFQMLKTELEAAMALCGVSSLEHISSQLITRKNTHSSSTAIVLRASL
jgi:(S)-2-hydroxy-acid oxidase